MEEAALSASEPIAPSDLVVEPEAAESAEGPIAGVTSDNWADLSEEATALAAAELEEQGSVLDGDNLGVGGAASCAPDDEAAEGEDLAESRFNALTLLEPPKEEEVEPSTEDLFALLQSDPAEEPAEAPLESDSVPPASEIATSNTAAVNTETIEESLAALDLEPKEEVDFEAEQLRACC